MIHKYEEKRELPQPLSWVIIILFSACIMGFGVLAYEVVCEGIRQWDFGQLPDAPSESIYSTEEPWTSRQPERQLPKLPEAKPKMPYKPPHVQLRERELKR